MKTLHSNIWYADEARADSPKKLLVCSDTGTLNLKSSGLQFSGRKTELNIEYISRLYLGRQSLNWAAYLIGLMIFVFLDLVLGSGAEMLLGTGWVLSKLFVMLAPICILLFWLPMKWLVVEYEAEGEQRRAYFSLADLNGFKGFVGGNQKLLREIEGATGELSTVH